MGFVACADKSEKTSDNLKDVNEEISTGDESVSPEPKTKGNSVTNMPKDSSNITPTQAIINAEEIVNEEVALELEPFIDSLDPRPFAVNCNQNGEMFIVCAPPSGNGTLYQVSTAGELKKICEVEGTFMGPGMAFDQNNDIYIPTGTELKKYKTDGTFEVVASGFENAWDVTVDKNNNVYVADEMGETVYRITPSGDKEVIIEPKRKTGLRYLQVGIEYNPVDDSLYVLYLGCIYRYSLSSENIMESQELIYKSTGIRCIAFDKDGNLYVDQNDSVIMIGQDKKTAKTYRINGGSNNFVGLNFGKGEFDENTLYIATSNNLSKFTRK
jgi:sugar lactone lactonase YvrE